MIALSTLISLAGLWFLLNWLYRDYRDDVFKLHLFKQRDRLFDLAADGKLAFDHPAYGMMRMALNAYLYNAQRTSFLWLVFAGFASGKSEDVRLEIGERVERWEKAMASLPEDVRSELLDIREQMNFRLIDHIIFTSPLFWLAVAPVVLSLVISLFGRAATDGVRRFVVRTANVDSIDFVAPGVVSDADGMKVLA